VSSKNGAATTSGAQPSSIIQPDSAFCAIGGFHLRSSTVPIAHRIAAPRTIDAPKGLRPMSAKSSPRSSAMPIIPSTSPVAFRRPSGSCRTRSAMSVDHTGIV